MSPLKRRVIVAGVTLLVVLASVGIPVYRTVNRLHLGKAIKPAIYRYPPAGRGDPCFSLSGSRENAEGATSGRVTGSRYLVRTPVNYDPLRKHPLLVVFAPADFGAWLNERFTGLTHKATASGFIVAYLGSSGPLDTAMLEALGTVADEIARRWCVDEEHIYYAGHSDGGTAAMAMGFLEGVTARPAAIVASAAGIRGEELGVYRCPMRPTAVMVWHSPSDSLFPVPEYGPMAARWWAKCNGCDPRPPPRKVDGCRAYRACAPGGRTLYCPYPGGHERWPQAGTARMIDFLRQAD